MNNLPYLIIWECTHLAITAQCFYDILMILFFSDLLLQCLLQQWRIEPIWKGVLGFSDHDIQSHILDESSLEGEEVLELHLLKLLHQGHLVYCWERLPDLHPHVFSDKWVEAQMKEKAKGSIEIEGMQMLIVFGFELESCELPI